MTTPAPLAHSALAFDDTALSRDVVSMAFYERQLSGAHGHSVSLRFTGVREPSALVPAHTTVERSWVEIDDKSADPEGSESRLPSSVSLATVGDAAILITTFRRHTVIQVSAPTRESALAAGNAISAHVPQERPNAEEVPFHVWHHTGSYADSDRRTMHRVEWAGISRNYPTNVASSLGLLMEAVRPSGGRIILWHGPPGGGKTTALRALLSSWSPWCEGQYVADPERLFGDPSYLFEVATTEDPARWNLIIAEDTDEFLRSSARQEAGSALGRLLNFTDGFLGQSSNSLILLTTNESVSQLHPAVVRPGRCLSEIEFSKFSPEEARRWLLDGTPAPSAASTLAELLALRGDLARLDTHTAESHPETGLYL